VNELLEEVKSFLNFTWVDPAKEKRILTYINSSIAYLKEVAGTDTLDVTTDHLAHDLLLNRVLYMDSQALDDFNKNYNGMIEELRIKYSVLNAD
jgi:hypothetical protein